MKPQQWLWSALLSTLPPDPPSSVVEWARQNVRLIGSARSEAYDPDITPWTKEPIECAANGVRKMTFVGPVQSGKSACGEIAICFWTATANGGDIQYNWQNDLAADARWSKRVEKILKACKPVMDRTSVDRFKWTKGLVVFPHCNLIMQGILTDRAVASDSIRFQTNEEIHDAEGWLPGRLQQAYNRTTAFWNSVIFNISNAGQKGDQLHQAFKSGTMQRWEVKCPGCGQFHTMRARWEESEPQLGGLRYETEGCITEGGDMNYSKLAPSIRFQMPCGFTVRDELLPRRSLSLSGKYSEPTNPAAFLTERSYTLEAVAIDYIPWVQLIQEKHKALVSLKYGDPKPWWDYLRERECQFVDTGDRPIVQRIILSESKKDRGGLPGRLARLGALDRQKGTIEIGELPHWWGLIQDVEELPDGKLHVLTVWEGKLLTDEDAAEIMSRHEVMPSSVVVDSGYDTMHVYQFCMKHGFNAVKGTGEQFFSHPATSFQAACQRIYSVEKPLHGMINQPPKYDYLPSGEKPLPDPGEPLFWFYSQAGIIDRLAWLRTSPLVKYEVPGDVSSDFLNHMDSWRRSQRKHPRTGQVISEWVQQKTRDDLLFCAAYCGMLMEMAGLIGIQEPEKQLEST